VAPSISCNINIQLTSYLFDFIIFPLSFFLSFSPLFGIFLHSFFLSLFRYLFTFFLSLSILRYLFTLFLSLSFSVSFYILSFALFFGIFLHSFFLSLFSSFFLHILFLSFSVSFLGTLFLSLSIFHFLFLSLYVFFSFYLTLLVFSDLFVAFNFILCLSSFLFLSVSLLSLCLPFILSLAPYPGFFDWFIPYFSITFHLQDYKSFEIKFFFIKFKSN
jgi:hypothetical protein